MISLIITKIINLMIIALIVNKQLKQATKNLKDFIKNKYSNEELL